MRIKMALSVASILVTQNLLLANETTKLDDVQVVTSATGFEQNIKDAPATITVITSEELEKKSYTDVTDALKNVPGVYVSGGGSNQSVMIRGMSAGYTLYLIDGKPMQNTGAFERNGGISGAQSNFLPPLESIERIEIIRGPASSLYGSDAMGGVINIITKKHSDKLTASIRTEYIKADSSNKVNNDSKNTEIYVNAPLIEKVLSMQITGGYLSSDESNYQTNNTEAIESDPDFSRKNIGGKLIFTPDENNTITAGYTYTIQERTHNPGISRSLYTTGSGTSMNGFSIDSNKYVYDSSGKQVGWDGQSVTSMGNTTYNYTTNNTKSYSKSIKYNYNVGHELEYDKLLINSYLNFDKAKNPTRVNARTNNGIELDTFTANTQGTYFFNSNKLSLGLNYKKEHLEDGATNGLSDELKILERYQWAMFIENEWSIKDNLFLTLSGRYDKNEDFGDHLSPKAYLVYHPTDNLTLKGGVLTGFKAPDMRNAATDFGSTSMGGTSIGNPDLKPETSVGYEAGIAYNNPEIGLSGSLMLFQTDFKDKIQRQSDYYCVAGVNCTLPNGVIVPGTSNTYGYKLQENVDEAEIKGIELTTDFDILDNLKYRHSYTYTDSEQKSGSSKGDPLNDISKHMFNAGIDWDVTSKLMIWTQANYRGKTAGSRTNGVMQYDKAYTFIDTGAVYNYSKDLKFTAGIYNLANKEVLPVDGYQSILDGRRYSVAMNLKF